MPWRVLSGGGHSKGLVGGDGIKRRRAISETTRKITIVVIAKSIVFLAVSTAIPI